MSPLFGGLEIHGVLHQNAGFLASSVRLPYPLDQATPRQTLACRMGLLPRHGHFPVDQLARGEPQGFIFLFAFVLCWTWVLGWILRESVGSYPSWKRQDWLGQIFHRCPGALDMQRPTASKVPAAQFDCAEAPKKGLDWLNLRGSWIMPLSKWLVRTVIILSYS